MNNKEDTIENRLATQGKEITQMCEEIENYLYPRCWDRPELLKRLNEVRKIRKDVFNVKREKTAENTISW